MWYRKAGVAGFFALLCAVPLFASAHATPISYTPAAGATELRTPGEISIYFTERIELRASSMKVFAPDGTEVQEGSALLDAHDPRLYRIPVRDAGEGVYTVVWQVVSVDDGHFTKGSFSFLVAADGRPFEGRAEGTTQVTYTTKLSDAFIGVVGLIGESLMLGVFLVYIAVVRPLRRLRPQLQELTRSYERVYIWLASVGALLLSASTLIVIIRKTLELMALRGESFRVALGVFMDSVGGAYMLYKVIAALAFLCVVLVLRRRIFVAERFAFPEIILAVLLGVIIFFQSKVSHAAASFFHPQLSVAVTALHLFFKELLVGGLVAIACLYKHLVEHGAKIGAALVLSLYDRLAGVAILIAGLSGTYITWLHLKRWEALFTTEWGARFALLLVFGLLLGGFRVLNQWVLGPLALRRSRLTHAIRITLLVEIAMGMVMLFYSGYIAITTPPFTVEQWSFAREVVSGDTSIRLDVHPYESGNFRVQTFDRISGAPRSADGLVIFADNIERGIDANVVEPTRRAPHSFVFPQSVLSPSGNWTVKVVAQQTGGYDANAAFELRYPDDVANSRYSDEVRSFDGFARTMLWVAAFFLLLVCALIVQAQLRIRRLSNMPPEERTPEFSLVPHTLVAIVLSVLICMVVLGMETRMLGGEFKERCVADGFSWRQAFPARDYEVVAPNSVVGCWVHDGHYHMPDYDEYLYHLSSY